MDVEPTTRPTERAGPAILCGAVQRMTLPMRSTRGRLLEWFHEK
jgi:hypothetical protein